MPRRSLKRELQERTALALAIEDLADISEQSGRRRERQSRTVGSEINAVGAAAKAWQKFVGGTAKLLRGQRAGDWLGHNV